MDKTYISPHERLKKYALEDISSVYEDFHLSQDGLNEAQIFQMRNKYGSNQIGYAVKNSFLHHLKRAFINPFSIILFVLAAVSFITDVCLQSNYGRNGTTVIIILSMLLLSGTVRLLQELKAGHAAELLTEKYRLPSLSAVRVISWKFLQRSLLSATLSNFLPAIGSLQISA